MAWNQLVGIGLAVAGGAGFFIWLPLARHALHRAEVVRDAGPETMDLGKEPPAVVNLLLHELEVTGDAFAATILDLAARRTVEVIQLSPEKHLLIPHRKPDAPLLAYEARALAVIEQAVTPEGHATPEGITDAMGHDSAETWFRMKLEIKQDARKRGLVGSPATARSTRALMLWSALPAAGFAVAAPTFGLVAAPIFLVLFIPGIVALVIGHPSSLTKAGRATASRWLGVKHFLAADGTFDELPAGAVAVWDRYLAYGAAMGLSGKAVQGLAEELRTSLSMQDLGKGARALAQAMHIHSKDPAHRRESRGEQLRVLYGPNADPDALYGPDNGDFWALLETMGTTARFALLVRTSDPDVWNEATKRRVDALMAAVPTELAGPAAHLARPLRRTIDLLSTGQAVDLQQTSKAAGWTEPAVEDALSGLVRGIAQHFGIEATSAAIMEALAGGPISASSLS